MITIAPSVATPRPGGRSADESRMSAATRRVEPRDRCVAFRLEEIVPWGRSFEEYLAMFALTEQDLAKRILGCGDGPAAFNAELSRRGGRMISVDPIYCFSAEQIRDRINATYPEILEQMTVNAHTLTWSHFSSPKEIGCARMNAMQEFLLDFPGGARAGRYLVGALPVLPFADREFELALCSHLLFLYSDRLSDQFHLDSLREMARVAEEVRVFPLLDLDARRSRHLGAILELLEIDGYELEVVSVPYELQKGGNEMLRLVRNPCA